MEIPKMRMPEVLEVEKIPEPPPEREQEEIFEAVKPSKKKVEIKNEVEEIKNEVETIQEPQPEPEPKEEEKPEPTKEQKQIKQKQQNRNQTQDKIKSRKQIKKNE